MWFANAGGLVVAFRAVSRSYVCRYNCETCRQPLLTLGHAIAHQRVIGCRAVRPLLRGQYVRVYCAYACVCGFRTNRQCKFVEHGQNICRARMASGCSKNIPVKCSLRGTKRIMRGTKRITDIYDDDERECCQCGKMAMIRRSRSKLGILLYCRECRTEVSDGTVRL